MWKTNNEICWATFSHKEADQLSSKLFC